MAATGVARTEPSAGNGPSGATLPQHSREVGPTVREASDTIDAEKVVRTEPPPGKIKEGATVTVVISDGLPKFDMPNLVGLSQADAQNVLASKGITQVTVNNVSLAPDDSNVGKVVSQNVAAGQKVTKAAAVTITVGKATAPTTTTTTTTTSTTTTTRPGSTTTTR